MAIFCISLSLTSPSSPYSHSLSSCSSFPTLPLPFPHLSLRCGRGHSTVRQAGHPPEPERQVHPAAGEIRSGPKDKPPPCDHPLPDARQCPAPQDPRHTWRPLPHSEHSQHRCLLPAHPSKILGLQLHSRWLLAQAHLPYCH